MSRPFAETAFVRAATRRGVLAVGALVLAACGASTPQKAAVDKPAVVTPGEPAAAASASRATAEAARPATNAKAESTGSTRRGRRGEPTPAADPASEPIPAAAQSAYDRALAAMRDAGLVACRERARAADSRVSRLSGTAGESRDRIPEREAAGRRARRARSRARDRSQACGREQRARHPVARNRQVRRRRARLSARARDRSRLRARALQLGRPARRLSASRRRGDRAVRGCIRARWRSPTRKSPVGSIDLRRRVRRTVRRKSRRRTAQ